jgi:hypothetical protein
LGSFVLLPFWYHKTIQRQYLEPWRFKSFCSFSSFTRSTASFRLFNFLGSIQVCIVCFASLFFSSLRFSSLPFASLPFASFLFPSLLFFSLFFSSLPFASLLFSSLLFSSLLYSSLRLFICLKLHLHICSLQLILSSFIFVFSVSLFNSTACPSKKTDDSLIMRYSSRKLEHSGKKVTKRHSIVSDVA